MEDIRPLSRSPTDPVVSLSSSTSSPTMSPSPATPASSSSRPKRVPSLSLDLSNLPPLQPPANPTNTLLFTNLNHPDVFRPDNLQTLRDLVEQSAPLHSWAPLRSFRRIIASFFSPEAAAHVRAVWEGECVLGEPVQVYYGRPTPLDAGQPGQIQHLELPDAGKLFFISPPPSPPHDWQMRLEGAPNKQVHADDLAEALAKLHHQAREEDVTSPSSSGAANAFPSPISSRSATTRSRSSTLVIYQPSDHGCSQDLPAIAVEDLTATFDEDEDMVDDMDTSSPHYDGFGVVGVPQQPILAHTARPPVELMNDA